MSRETEKLNPKYYTDTIAYHLKNIFNPQKATGYIGYGVVPAFLTAVTTYGVTDARGMYDVPVFETSDAVISAEYDMALDGRLDAVEALYATFDDLDKQVEIAKIEYRDDPDTLTEQVRELARERTKAEADLVYAAENLHDELLTAPQMTEASFKELAAEWDTAGLNNLNVNIPTDTNFDAFDECRLEQDAANDIKTCLVKSAHNEATTGAVTLTFLSPLAAFMFFSAIGALILMPGGMGQNWKPKPQKTDYRQKHKVRN